MDMYCRFKCVSNYSDETSDKCTIHAIKIICHFTRVFFIVELPLRFRPLLLTPEELELTGLVRLQKRIEIDLVVYSVMFGIRLDNKPV